jgi:glycerophosphoryl diester phosphodiesterase
MGIGISVHMLVIGHRGASADAPENTHAAFRAAWAQEADGVEFDVQVTADGVPVVFHDDRLTRVAGVDRAVAEATWSDLAGLDVGSWRGSKWAGERIPRLDDLLRELPAGRRALVEIKSAAAAVPAIASVLRGYRPRRLDITILAFELVVLERVAVELPGWTRMPNIGEDALSRVSVEEGLRRLREGGCAGASLAWCAGAETDWLPRLRAAGLRSAVWTVDDPAAARAARAAGAELLITNRPGEIRRALAS